ncbi:MAG: geranylgeranylglycerol-phosphate geranylgeranyltransferase [Candidatus Cloacimonetes bacterium]|nr:geranylgeranylglycerol-phosphate geranylgeranyltransferase [Candidatus Cloacimonadota bacterium]
MKNYLLIIRPLNCLFIGFAVLVGGWLNTEVESYPVLLIAMLVAMLIGAGGYVINDFFDIRIDSINKPHRLLPRGVFKPEFAFMYALFLFMFGISISIFTINFWAIFIAVLNSILLYHYAKSLKNTILWGNLVISYITGSALLYGAVITNNILNILPLIIFTILYTFVREIIKDAEDEKADRIIGVKTYATAFGQKQAVYISLIPALLLAISLYIYYIEKLISKSLFEIVILVYLIPLIFIYLYLLIKINPERLHRSSVFIKIHMLILLITYIIVI